MARRLSKAGRAAISAASKERWRKLREEKEQQETQSSPSNQSGWLGDYGKLVLAAKAKMDLAMTYADDGAQLTAAMLAAEAVQLLLKAHATKQEMLFKMDKQG